MRTAIQESDLPTACYPGRSAGLLIIAIRSCHNGYRQGLQQATLTRGQLQVNFFYTGCHTVQSGCSKIVFHRVEYARAHKCRNQGYEALPFSAALVDYKITM